MIVMADDGGCAACPLPELGDDEEEELYMSFFSTSTVLSR